MGRTLAQYVLDGGALLYRIPWSHGCNFKIICQLYVNYVIGRFGKAFIVFDGYNDGPSVKDSAHQRRGHRTGSDGILTHKTLLA